MAADNTRKTSNVIHDLANLKTQVDKNTDSISKAVSPNDGKINLSVGTGLSLGDGSANASANQETNTQWTINLDPDNIVANKYVKTIDGVGPNSTTGDVDLKSTDDSLKVTPDATNNSIDLTLNTTIPTVNDKQIGLVEGTGINITGDNATTNMDANSSQTISLNASLNDLNNVNATSASKDQALVYNGTEWVPGTVSGGDGTVKKVGGVGPNTTTGDVSLKSDGNTLTITPDTANNTVKLEANLTTLNSSLSSTLPFVKIDGTSKMTGNLQAPGIKGIQTRDANEDPDNPISFTEVIEGGADGGDASDDYTQWLCSGHIYMGYTGSDPDSQTYRIKNLQEPVDDHDAATKQYVDGKTDNIPTNVVNKLNTKTGEITIKSDDSNTIGVATSDQNITLNLSANLGQLKDVNSTAAAQNQVLTWDDSAKEWKPAASQTGGVTELSALNDTNIDDPENGEILVYDKVSGKWNNQSPGENTAELPISSSDETVKLSDDTVGGKTSNFVVETGTDVFKLVASASVFGTDTNPNGGPEVISIVGDGWGGIIVGDSVTGNRIPDGTVVVSKDADNLRVTLSQATTGDTVATEELTFSHPAPASAQFQERMRIDGIGQITAETPGYDDNVQATSLVTKAWVEANSGSGGVSNLPISSFDKKVTLSDDGNGKFQIATGDSEADKTVRVTVDEDGRVLVGNNAGENENFTYHFRTQDNCQFVLESNAGVPQLKLKADDFWYYFSLSPDDDFFRLVSYNGSNAESFNIFTAKTDGDIQFSQNAIVSGRVQTDTITTKDDVDGDASIVLSDGAMYIAGTDINESESPKLYFRGHTSAATSVANLGYIQATVEAGSSYKGTLGFWSAIGGAPYYRDEPDFSINSVGQLHAATDYEPEDDNSLVTKGYVTNTGGGMGTLPIANDDETVQLDDLTNPIWTNAFNIDIGDDKDNRKTVLRAVRPSDSLIPGGVGRQNIIVFGNDNYTDYDAVPSQVGISFQGPYIETNPNARDFLASLTVEQSRGDGYRDSDFVFYINKTGTSTQNMVEVARITRSGGGLFTGSVEVDTSSSTCAVFESTTLSAQVKCIAQSGTTWHGLNNGKWAVDYWPTGTTVYTEGLRLDLDDGFVTSAGGFGASIFTSKEAIEYIAAQGTPGKEGYVPEIPGDGKIDFGAHNITISANATDGRIKLRNNASGNANICQLGTTQWCSTFGSFGGGYSWWGQNIELDSTDYPETDPLHSTEGLNFKTRYTGSANIGSFVMSPMRDGRWGTLHGSMRVYPSTGGTQASLPHKAMPQVLGWDAYDGRLGVGYKALTNTRQYVRGPDYIVQAAISYNATGLYAQYLLGDPQVSNIGNAYWQTKDGNIYKCVDTVGDGNVADLVWEIVDRNAKQDVIYNEGTPEQYVQNEFVYQSSQGTVNNYQRTYITCDHSLASWHYGTFIESPSWATEASLYDGTPNPKNEAWRMGNYAGVRVENCTLTKTAGIAASFVGNQNASAAGNAYSFYAMGTAPSRFNGGVHTDTITTKDAAGTDAKIELGKSDATISTGGQTRATFGSGGQLLKLADSTGFTEKVQYGLIVNPSVPAECTNSFYSFRSSPKITTKTATLYHACAYNRDGVGEQYGFYYGVSTTNPVKVGNVGFRANCLDADFAFYADQPSVPSLFKGEIRCDTFTGTSGTGPEISLADSQIKLFGSGGGEYQPTTNNSATTKKYVDSRIWKGTQSEYDALSSYDDDILYCITG